MMELKGRNINLRNCLLMKRRKMRRQWETILLWRKKVPWLILPGKTLLTPLPLPPPLPGNKTKMNPAIAQRTAGQTFYLLQLKPDLLGNFNK